MKNFDNKDNLTDRQNLKDGHTDDVYSKVTDSFVGSPKEFREPPNYEPEYTKEELARFVEKYEYNQQVLKEHGVQDNAYFYNPYKKATAGKLRGAADPYREIMADYLAEITERGKKSVALDSKHVSFQLTPKKYQASKKDGRPAQMRFQVDIQTASSLVKGASLVVTRSKKRRRGHWNGEFYYLSQWTVLFDFPKVKKHMQVYEETHTPNEKMVEKETWGYKNIEKSSEESIHKAGDLLCRLVVAHAKQYGENY